jgi:hypothetical protein
MMVAHDWLNGIWEIDALQDVRSHCRVDLHSLEFCSRERAGLVEDVLWDGQLTSVVKQSSGAIHVA